MTDQLHVLDDAGKARVLKRVRRQRERCPACGNRSFRVGGALYLGFLFLSEPTDRYLVALTCTNPACPSPRTGTKQPESVVRGADG